MGSEKKAAADQEDANETMIPIAQLCAECWPTLIVSVRLGGRCKRDMIRQHTPLSVT